MQLGPELPFTIDGKYVKGTDSGVGNAFYRPIGPGFFQALRIPLKRGRLFTTQDRREHAAGRDHQRNGRAAVLEGENPIGQRITVGQPFVPELADAVSARNRRHCRRRPRRVAERASAGNRVPADVPAERQSRRRSSSGCCRTQVVVRADGSAGAVTQAVQQAIWSVDPGQPVSDVRLMREIVQRSLGGQTFNAALLGGLAELALLLAAVGLYGVISHLVGQQTREIGIRMALGATHTSVLTLFVRHALLLVAAGIVIGLAGAFGLDALPARCSSDISTTDPWVFVLAPALLLGVALIAALRPALRAARIDPHARCAEIDTTPPPRSLSWIRRRLSGGPGCCTARPGRGLVAV